MARKFSRVPELSLKAFTHGGPKERTDFIDSLMEGFQYFGFIILKDHAVNRDLLKRAYQLSAEFFALSEPEKRRLVAGADGQRGYTPFGKEHAKDAKIADLKEFWHVGREFAPSSPLAKIYPPNVWPAAPAGFRDTFLNLYTALEDAGFSMLEALAPSLGVSADYFRKMATDGNSILRLLHYPPTPPNPDGIRAEAHEDINVITLLLGAEEAGLQLLTREGSWIDVNPPEGALVVNIGDMLQRLTNHKLRSTTHRVVNPAPARAHLPRYSIPFFLHFAPDYPIETLPSCIDAANPNRYPEPISAQDYLLERLREIRLA